MRMRFRVFLIAALWSLTMALAGCSSSGQPALPGGGDNPVNPVNPDNPGTGGDDPVTPTGPNDIGLLIEAGNRSYYVTPDNKSVFLDVPKDNIFTPYTAAASGEDVYIAGSADGTIKGPVYVKNGAGPVILNAPENGYLADFNNIDIKIAAVNGRLHSAVRYSGRDGFTYDLSGYYIDGVLQTLLPDNNGRNPVVNAVRVIGSDVYLAGSYIRVNSTSASGGGEDIDHDQIPALWKNGTLIDLTCNNCSEGEVMDVVEAADGSVVAAGSYIKDGGTLTGCIWLVKNVGGVIIVDQTDITGYIEALNAGAADNDVYVLVKNSANGRDIVKGTLSGGKLDNMTKDEITETSTVTGGSSTETVVGVRELFPGDNSVYLKTYIEGNPNPMYHYAKNGGAMQKQSLPLPDGVDNSTLEESDIRKIIDSGGTVHVLGELRLKDSSCVVVYWRGDVAYTIYKGSTRYSLDMAADGSGRAHILLKADTRHALYLTADASGVRSGDLPVIPADADATIKDYVFSGGNFYAATDRYGYYKDETLNSLSVVSPSPDVTSIFIQKLLVDKGVVHIAGDVSYVDGSERAAYWRNGVFTSLHDAAAGSHLATSQVQDMVISPSGAVYITGMCTDNSSKDLACFWKDGVFKALRPTAGFDSSALETNNYHPLVFHGDAAYFSGRVYSYIGAGSTKEVYSGSSVIWDENGDVYVEASPSNKSAEVLSQRFADVRSGPQGLYALYHVSYQENVPNETALWLDKNRLDNPFPVPAGAALEDVDVVAPRESGFAAAGTYSVGSVYHDAYWENGSTITTLSSGPEISPDGNEIEGGDIYSVFERDSGGCSSFYYFKNGAGPVDVGSPDKCTQIEVKRIIGGDFYLAGYERERNGGGTTYRLWKNGQPVQALKLPASYNSAEVEDIALSADGSLYAAGRVDVRSFGRKAVLWKDGAFRELHPEGADEADSRVRLVRSSNGG